MEVELVFFLYPYQWCRKMFRYGEGEGRGGGGGVGLALRACVLWFKSIHVRNHLVKLCPEIRGGGGWSPPPLPYATAYSED